MADATPPFPAPKPWRIPTRAIAVRLFLTCWVVYAMHFATDIVREIYPAVALGDHFSFRVDEYANLHPDLFELPGYGWHIGNNPGASMVAAIPYALARPIIDPIVARVQAGRAASGQTAPPAFDTPSANARAFFAEAWRRGLDVKLVLAAMVMHWFCMAPSSALGVVAMFFLLRLLLRSDRAAMWLALLYAFGTPVFFRTGFLNHNLMIGHIVFLGFLVLWDPSGSRRFTLNTRYVLAGLAGGTAVLFDYSGIIFLLTLFTYGLWKRWADTGIGDAVRYGAVYVAGSFAPIALLWFYQWRSFGHPLYPGQHWMPPVEWIELGYQGYGPPQLELLVALVLDYRFGVFVACPILLLGALYPVLARGADKAIPLPELAFLLGSFVALWVFFAGSNYTRLQYNTGIRYMAPILPLLFVPTAVMVARLGARARYLVAVASVAIAWPLAMYREVETDFGMLDPMLRTFLGGFELPVLTTVSRLPEQFSALLPTGTSPLPLFALGAALLYAIWSPRFYPAVGAE